MASTGNISDVARALGISRQAVSRQVANRDRTGAPMPGADGLYDVEAYRKWYVEDFKPKSGPRRGIRAEKS